MAERNFPAAARAYEKVVALAPSEGLAHAQLGEVYRDLGRFPDAIRSLSEAVKLDPAPAAYWNALGTVLAAGNQIADAEKAFAQAATREASNALYIYNRALALERLGQRDQAIAQYQQAAALGYPLARTAQPVGEIESLRVTRVRIAAAERWGR